MKRDNDRQTAIILSIVGIVPVIWLALLIAPSISGGLPEIAANLATLFDNPFSIKLCGDSLKTVLILLLCYGMGIGIYFSTRKNSRRREEHGSAKWGNVRAIDKKYRQKPLSENKLMTQNVCIGLNAKKHRRNPIRRCSHFVEEGRIVPQYSFSQNEYFPTTRRLSHGG